MVRISRYLENRTLHPRPWAHSALVEGFVRWTFAFPRKTRVRIENLAHLPQDRPAIVVMNHTNIYNYVPFLAQLYWEYRADPQWPFPAYGFWAKARFFHQPLAGRFLTACNVLPLPSRGYLISKDFKDSCGRAPNHSQYRLLRDLVDGTVDRADFLRQADEALRAFVTKPHNQFDPDRQAYADFIEQQYERLMGLVMRISEQALLKQGINILIFPEGGTSTRLRQGQVGVAQLALKTNAPVVPVAGNQLDLLYPNLLPFSRGGEAVYRVGEPLTTADVLAPCAIDQPFVPFSRAAQLAYQDNFRTATGLIMARLNELLDPAYQYAADAPPPKRQGANRFV